MDQITPSDLTLFGDAQTALQAAQNTFQFISAHIGKVYALTPQDQVDLKTGVITRQTQKAIPDPCAGQPATAEGELP